MPLSFQDIIDNISEAMIGIEDEEVIADIHNKICSRKVKSIGDSLWEYTGDNDNDPEN